MTEKVLLASEVAAIFGVTIGTVGRWADEGKLPGFRTPGGHRRFRREDIEEFLRVQLEAAGASEAVS